MTDIALTDPEPTADTVAKLLADSMTAHTLAAHMRRQQNRTAAQSALQRAFDLRMQAHDMDPKHESPAWQAEQAHTANGVDTHSALMSFYASQGLGATT